MTLRTRHGNHKKHGVGPVIEVLPADELPAPIADLDAKTELVEIQRVDGKVVSKEAARALGRLGGLRTAKRVKLARTLGIAKIAADKAFAPYMQAAEEFVKEELATRAKSAGGHVGPAASSMIASASLQLATSRFAFDKFAATEEIVWANLGSRMADASRQNLLAAYELAVREAQIRSQRDDDGPPPGFVHAIDSE